MKNQGVDFLSGGRAPVLPFRTLMRTPSSEVEMTWAVGKREEEGTSRGAAFCLESWGLVYLALDGGGLEGKAASLERFRKYVRKCPTLPGAGGEGLLGFAHFRKDLAGLEKVFLRFIVESEAEKRAWDQEEETRRILLGKRDPLAKSRR